MTSSVVRKDVPGHWTLVPKPEQGQVMSVTCSARECQQKGNRIIPGPEVRRQTLGQRKRSKVVALICAEMIRWLQDGLNDTQQPQINRDQPRRPPTAYQPTAKLEQ